MKISDTLRQEAMPEMVYAICKLVARKEYTSDQIADLITLKSHNKSDYYKAFNFTKDCGFISDNESSVKLLLPKASIKSFRDFRLQVVKSVFVDQFSIFPKVASWFLNQNTQIFRYKASQDFANQIPESVIGGIEKDYALGFRFWMVSLGFAASSKHGASQSIIFSTNTIIEDWLRIDQPFEKDKLIQARKFFECLVESIPIFAACIHGQELSLSLSMGLRVLHLNEVITINYTPDTGDEWHLSKSLMYMDTNDFTEIIVRSI